MANKKVKQYDVFKVTISICLVILTLSASYWLAIGPLLDKINTKDKGIKNQDNIKQGGTPDKGVGDEFSLKDGKKIIVTRVSMIDFKNPSYKNNNLLADFYNTRTIDMTINYDGGLPDNIIASLKLVRGDGTGVIPIERTNVKEHGGYVFRIAIEENKEYWLQFGDGTKVKLNPYDYRLNS